MYLSLQELINLWFHEYLTVEFLFSRNLKKHYKYSIEYEMCFRALIGSVGCPAEFSN